jgi:hypothetical protein
MGPLLKCKIVIAKIFETLVKSPAVKIGGKKKYGTFLVKVL